MESAHRAALSSGKPVAGEWGYCLLLKQSTIAFSRGMSQVGKQIGLWYFYLKLF